MIDELMNQGMSEKEAIEYLDRELEEAIPDAVSYTHLTLPTKA